MLLLEMNLVHLSKNRKKNKGKNRREEKRIHILLHRLRKCLSQTAVGWLVRWPAISIHRIKISSTFHSSVSNGLYAFVLLLLLLFFGMVWFV